MLHRLTLISFKQDMKRWHWWITTNVHDLEIYSIFLELQSVMEKMENALWKRKRPGMDARKPKILNIIFQCFQSFESIAWFDILCVGSIRACELCRHWIDKLRLSKFIHSCWLCCVLYLASLPTETMDVVYRDGDYYR